MHGWKSIAATVFFAGGSLIGASHAAPVQINFETGPIGIAASPVLQAALGPGRDHGNARSADRRQLLLRSFDHRQLSSNPEREVGFYDGGSGQLLVHRRFLFSAVADQHRLNGDITVMNDVGGPVIDQVLVVVTGVGARARGLLGAIRSSTPVSCQTRVTI